jgi:integrase
LARPVKPENAWIKKAGLKYVTLRKGRYLYRPYLGDRKYGPEIMLAPESAKPQEIIRRYEEILRAEQPAETIDWLLGYYMEHKKVAPRTVKDYTNYRRKMNEFHGFGQARLTQVDRFVIQEFLDEYPADTQANRMIQMLKAAWFFAALRIRNLPDNPCAKVPLNSETPRTRYITDDEYKAAHRIASAQRTPYLAVMMELAYLLRARVSELLAMERTQLNEEGLLLIRGKGSKDEITLWSERLKRAVDAADKLHPTTISRYLLHNADASPISMTAYKLAWQRCRQKLIESGAMPVDDQFTFHDLKARGITDHPTKHGGHKSEKMKAVYDRLPDVIKATR